VYRAKVGQLTAAFQDDALKAQAFELLRELIAAVVLTPENGDLTIELRGEFASMLSLFAGAETQKAPAGVPGGVADQGGRGDRI
jgi:site-specific DNA recombinase